MEHKASSIHFVCFLFKKLFHSIFNWSIVNTKNFYSIFFIVVTKPPLKAQIKSYPHPEAPLALSTYKLFPPT